VPDPDIDALRALDPLILPDALLKLIVADGASRAELHVVGNNAGIVSLANVLRWLAAAEREALHLHDLPFVWSTGAASLSVHRTEQAHEGRYGVVRRLEAWTAFAWLLDAAELPRLADSLNLLAAIGGREGATYDAPGAWDAAVYVRVDETLDGA
jgi:hypothetical protein